MRFFIEQGDWLCNLHGDTYRRDTAKEASVSDSVCALMVSG